MPPRCLARHSRDGSPQGAVKTGVLLVLLSSLSCLVRLYFLIADQKETHNAKRALIPSTCVLAPLARDPPYPPPAPAAGSGADERFLGQRRANRGAPHAPREAARRFGALLRPALGWAPSSWLALSARRHLLRGPCPRPWRLTRTPG